MSRSNKPMKVKCPHCRSEFSYYASEFRPFCSEKCRMVDLGHWLNESYKVPSATPLTEEDFLAMEQMYGQENEEDANEENKVENKKDNQEDNQDEGH